MVYLFTIISNEVEDFIREIKIDADAKFYDLHKAILASCNYTDDQLTSFFICNEDWELGQEIQLEDMGNTGVDEDLYLMNETRLSELVEDEKQRLTYVFDPLNERMLFMELSKIIFGNPQPEAVCSRAHGEAPAQTDLFNDSAIKETTKTSEDLSEDFYGSEEFNSEEFDPEGFEISEGNPYN